MTSSPARKWRRRGCLALLLLPLALAGACWLDADLANRRMEADWRRQLGGQSFEERYPPREANATALDLEPLAARLGIDLVPAHRQQDPPTTGETASEWATIKSSLEPLYEQLLQAENGTLPPLPEPLAAFLDRHRETAVEIVGRQLAGPPPSWELDLRQGVSLALPNEIGHFDLQRLLILESLRRRRAGRDDAGRPLEASWQLLESRHHNPTLVGQLVAAEVLHLQLSAVRRSCSSQSRWAERYRQLELQAPIFTALELEARQAYASSRAPDSVEGEPLPGWLQPLMVRGLRDYARRMHEAVGLLRDADLRTFDSQAFFEARYAAAPKWLIVTRLLLPNVFNAWPRAARAELAAELTAQVVEARRAGSAAGDGEQRRPARIEGFQWLHRRAGERLTLELEGTFGEPFERPLALRHELIADGSGGWRCGG